MLTKFFVAISNLPLRLIVSLVSFWFLNSFRFNSPSNFRFSSILTLEQNLKIILKRKHQSDYLQRKKNKFTLIRVCVLHESRNNIRKICAHRSINIFNFIARPFGFFLSHCSKTERQFGQVFRKVTKIGRIIVSLDG